MVRGLLRWLRQRISSEPAARIGKRLVCGGWQSVEVFFEGEELPYIVDAPLNVSDSEIIKRAYQLRQLRQRYPYLS